MIVTGYEMTKLGTKCPGYEMTGNHRDNHYYLKMSVINCLPLCHSVVAVVLVFYRPSTLFRSFRARSVNLSSPFLGKPPRQLTNT